MRWLRKKPGSIGLALGGGGARGLAHIVVLETLDEMGIRPKRIAGTSMGAVLGSLYASGFSGAQIRALASEMVPTRPEKLTDLFLRKDLLRWVDLIDPAFHRGALLKGEKFLRFLTHSMQCGTFEDLEIPLSVVATDFYTGREEVFSSGELVPAVQASMAIPGVFASVQRDGKFLVDGGLVNPVPWSVLKRECDLVIAVDVGGIPEIRQERPDFFDAVLGSFDVIQAGLVREQLKTDPPNIYLRPAIQGVGILEFHKGEQVLRQSASLRDELRHRLKRKVGA